MHIPKTECEFSDADGDTIEIKGEQTDANVQDNVSVLDFEYYINHCGPWILVLNGVETPTTT